MPRLPRSPHDLLAVLLAELSDEELARAESEAIVQRQSLSQYAWHRLLELQELKQKQPPAGPDPDLETKEYCQ